MDLTHGGRRGSDELAKNVTRVDDTMCVPHLTPLEQTILYSHKLKGSALRQV